MSLPKVDCNLTVLNIDDELRARIIDKLLITGRLVAEIAEEFQVRPSLVVQVGRLADIDVTKRDHSLKLHRQAYDLFQQGKGAKDEAHEMFLDSIREALAKRLVEAGALHGMDPLELEDHRIAKEALAEIEAEGSDIPENMPSLENDPGSTEDLQ